MLLKMTSGASCCLLPILVSMAQEPDFSVGSEARRSACAQLAEYALGIMEARGEGLSAIDTVRSMEISVAGRDEGQVFVLRILTDIANEYFDAGTSASIAEINLLHPCVTQDLTLDRTWLPEWLKVVSPDHPNYAAIRILNNRTDEELAAMSQEELAALVPQQHGGANIAELFEGLQRESTTFTPYEMRTGGMLQGCGVEYSVWTRDWAYKNGNLVVLNGSISINYNPENGALFQSLKVLGYDLEELTPVPFDIPYAYLLTSNASTAGREATTFKCENGGFCSATADAVDEVFRGFVEADLRLAYQRRGGGTDVFADVSLELLRGDPVVFFEPWMRCLNEFALNASESLGD